MRVIFLDIDGVLNGHERWANGYCGIRPQNVEVLNKILKLLPNVKLVISSAWRYMVPQAMTLKGFEYLLIVSGLDCKGRVVGMTVKDEVLKTRGAQIKEYIQTHPITKYVAIDDMLYDFDKYNIKYVLTDPAVGLTEKQIPAIISHLQ